MEKTWGGMINCPIRIEVALGGREIIAQQGGVPRGKGAFFVLIGKTAVRCFLKGGRS